MLVKEVFIKISGIFNSLVVVIKILVCLNMCCVMVDLIIM